MYQNQVKYARMVQKNALAITNLKHYRTQTIVFDQKNVLTLLYICFTINSLISRQNTIIWCRETRYFFGYVVVNGCYIALAYFPTKLVVV